MMNNMQPLEDPGKWEFEGGTASYTGNLIHDAINFAVEKHTGQMRKGTDKPYIQHPFEVMQILTENGCSEKVRAAGMLHDVLEDTKTTREEIQDIFGNDVLKLVTSLTEDKSKPWRERKQTTIDSLDAAKYEIKLVCIADKLSNLRSMAEDLTVSGESLWQRFNAPKNEIEWYYWQVLGKMTNFKYTKMYKECLILLIQVFIGVDYYYFLAFYIFVIVIDFFYTPAQVEFT